LGADGGVWTKLGERLLHRDPRGTWHDVAWPDGASEPSIAMSSDGRELWIAATIDGATVVLATASDGQAPPSAPEPTP
jgi:hypothetical protein